MPGKNFNVTWAKITASELKIFPMRGRVVPEFKKYGIKIYREIIVKAWRIIYRIDGHNVNMLAVFDSRRNMEDILLDRILTP